MYPIADDQQFVADLLKEEKVLLVQGSGFNWNQSDHFRIVFLPHEDVLQEAISRLARFLERYRQKHGRKASSTAAKAS
jgi:alanine-synthesizing transaminase